MTEKQAIAETEAHWGQMVDWVKKQNMSKKVSIIEMEKKLSTSWFDGDCALCDTFYLLAMRCGKCPLAIKFDRCGSIIGDPWRGVRYSKTWGEWLKHGEIMLEQIRRL